MVHILKIDYFPFLPNSYCQENDSVKLKCLKIAQAKYENNL